ncbi:polysaccharide biosynthesis tyrosine autokinase [Gordonia amicalis]|nr:polysaccharide biosynthesis tyrosine autokinase [Gordonia amicalis]
MILGLIGSLLATPVYQATSTLYVSSSANEASSASAYQGSLASEQRVESYTELAVSYVVLQEAIRSAGLSISPSEASSSLTATATPDTVLLSISARDRDPSRAEALANGVADALSRYVSQLETPAGAADPVVRLSVIGPASAPDSPVFPRTSRFLLIGIVLGFGAGAVGVILWSRFSDRIRSSEDITETIDVPVLGEIPSDSALHGGGRVSFSAGWSPVAESYRKLRTNVEFAGFETESRVVLVTSPIMGEGKTTTAVNLAAALAEAGKRVLIVDADLRRPQVAERLAVSASVGVSSWLRGDADLMDLILPTGTENLSVLAAAGPLPPNPSELLGSNKLAAGLEKLSETFDFVIIDSPPVLPVTDAIVLARRVSSVLLVVRAGVSKRRAVISAIAELGIADVPVSGVVLTDAEREGGRGYEYYGGYVVPEKSNI